MLTALTGPFIQADPTPTLTVPAEQVTPGFGGFAIIVFLVLVVFLLVWDMQRRIRRARYRGEINEELDLAEAEAVAAEAAAAEETPASDAEAADGTENAAGEKPTA